MDETSNAHPDPAAVTEGSGDPLDRGTGRRTSGGGLTNADFVPAHGDGGDDSPLEKIKQAVGLSNPRGKELDDEMQRPPDRRSPLT